MRNFHKSESGRNMLEMIAILALGILIILGSMWGLKTAFLSAQVGQITEDISTAVTERRYQIAQSGTSQAKRSKRTVGSTEMTIENETSGADKGSFTILLTSQNKKICEEMKKYVVFTPKKIEINGSTENECAESNNIKFYFDGYNRGNGGRGGNSGRGGNGGDGGDNGGRGGNGDGGNGGHGGNGGNGGNGGGEDDNAGNGDDPLKSVCDKVTVKNHCCASQYDPRTGCLIKRQQRCADTHHCNLEDCQCVPYEECPTTYPDAQCYPGQTDASRTLENGKVCHKCSGSPITQCYVNYKEGKCPATQIIKDHIVLKNKKECSLCEECPENKVPNTNQTECELCPEGKKTNGKNGICEECDTTAICPTCPSEKPYWKDGECVKCNPQTTPDGANSDTCVCETGYTDITTMDGRHFCAPLCKPGEDVGVILMVDKSSSTIDNGTKPKIENAVANLAIPENIATALYFDVDSAKTTPLIGLTYAFNALSQIKSKVKNQAIRYVGDTSFDIAFNDVETKLCDSKRTLLILLWTDAVLNENNNRKKTQYARTLSDLRKKCSAKTNYYAMTMGANTLYNESKHYNFDEQELMNQDIYKFVMENYCVSQ